MRGQSVFPLIMYSKRNVMNCKNFIMLDKAIFLSRNTPFQTVVYFLYGTNK